ncbi:hypothetical protein B0H14DRAFT_2336659, partial [Mycena olivaceomarginata]
GFQLIRWDGIAPRPLFDSQGRIFLVLAGRPVADGYAAAATRAYEFMKTMGTAAGFSASMRHHRRGLFAAINVGLTYGKGQDAPTWLDNKHHTRLAEDLLANKDLARMASFASSAFCLWAPRLHGYYADYNARLQTQRLQTGLPPLHRPFPKSVFSCAAFNFGPNAWTFKHRDVCNLPFGWCAIQALGHFDPTRGGHLVLWDLKLVVEFPPGALILLPSATVSHSNVPVQPGDERASFTQFTAGGIFRFVDNGFQTLAQLAAADPGELARLTARRDRRWEEGLELLSTIEELSDA